MTDRELLELAAKAAGLFILDISGRHCLVGPAESARRWAPLDSDGDALRLAIKVDVNLIRFPSMTSVRTGRIVNWFSEQDNGDPMSATRRAIVRAAAEVGRAMP